jgi:erythromycin esterase
MKIKTCRVAKMMQCLKMPVSRNHSNFINNQSLIKPMRFVTILAFLVLAFSASGQLQLAYNTSFELPKGKNKFHSWSLYTNAGQYIITPSTGSTHSGNYSLLIDGKNATRSASDDDAGAFYTALPSQLLAGKTKVKLEAWLKLDSPAYAGIWLQQSGSGGQKVDGAFPDTLHVVNGWQHVQLEVQLNKSSNQVYCGGMLNGKGKVWFDDFRIYIDDLLVSDIAKPVSAPSSQISWIKKHQLPLLSITAQQNNADLDALFQLANNANVVALGEPTHGTSEVFTLRLRLLQYLVEKKGFNTFMIEDELPEAGLLNDYVLYGKDTAVNLINKYLFPVWRNRELVALVEWIRQYNITHDRKVQFRGMDIQSARVARQNIVSFAAGRSEPLHKMAKELIEINTRLNTNSDKNKRQLIKDSLVQLSSAMRSYFDSAFKSTATSVPIDTLNWISLNITILTQLYPNLDWTKPSYYRDSCMAQNIIDYASQYPETKMLIWAHNSHVSRAQGMMGSWLSQHFKDRYFTIGFATSQGTYTASVDFPKTAWKSYQLEDPYAGTLEYYLQQAGDKYILPLRKKDMSQKDAAWLRHPLNMRSIGFMNMEDQFSPATPATDYDALIFIKQTSNSKSYMLK